MLKDRLTPNTGPTFLSGQVFDDLHRSGRFDAGDPALAGQRILLYTETDGRLSPHPVRSTTTDAAGTYAFADLPALPPDTSYVLAEGKTDGWPQTAPAADAPNTLALPHGRRGYVVAAADGVPLLTSGGAVVGPGGAGAVTLDALNNGTIGTISFNDGQGHSGSTAAYLSQFHVTYVGDDGTTATFNTFCIDLAHEVRTGQRTATDVRGDLATAFANGSRMAFIEENYGLADLSSNPVQAAAVQLALWDLCLPHDPMFFTKDAQGGYNSGDPTVFNVSLGGTADADRIAALADQYLKASVGAKVQGGWLDAARQGDAPDRGQSLLIPGPWYRFGNVGPVARPDAYTLTEDQALHVSAAQGVLANDAAPAGDTLTARLVRGPEHGRLQLNADGSFEYQPKRGFIGTDTFTYRAQDGKTESRAATVTLTVVPLNVQGAFTITGMEGEETGLEAVATFSDQSGTEDLASYGARVVWGDGTTSAGLVTYDPAAQTYTVYGSHQYAAAGDYPVRADVSFRGAPLGDAKGAAVIARFVATADVYYVRHDTPFVTDGRDNPSLLANDLDDVSLLRVLSTTAPRHGVLVLGQAGAFTYTPGAGYGGDDSFTYTVAYRSTVSTATVTLHVQNTAPVANDDTYFGDIHAGATYRVLPVPEVTSVVANDVDIDGDRLRVTSYTQPQYGAVAFNANGTFTYTAGPNFNGQDSFTYTVSDGLQTATARVTLLASNDPALAGSPFLLPDPQVPAAPLPKLPTVADLRKELVDNHLRSILAQLGKEPLISTDSVALYVDNPFTGEVSGSVMVGDLAKEGGPIGQVTIRRSSDILGTIYLPEKDAKGEFTKYDKLDISKEGVTGTLPLGADGYIKFDKGFNGAQFTDGQLKITIDKNGAITLTKNGKELAYDPEKEELNVKVPRLGTFKAGKSGFEIAFANTLSLKWHWDKDLKTTGAVGSLLLGSAGSVNFGYSKQQGPQLGLKFTRKGIDIAASYSKNSIKVDGSYSWEGRAQPKPIQGVVGVSLEVDKDTKTAKFVFGIKF